MNAELPPFKNGEHNSQSVLTIDRVITPLSSSLAVTDLSATFQTVELEI